MWVYKYVGVCVRLGGVCGSGWVGVSLSVCLPHQHTHSLALSVCDTLFLSNLVVLGFRRCIGL